jgi:hypothetical protein
VKKGRRKRLHEANTLRMAKTAARNADVRPLDAYMSMTKRKL